MKLLLIIALFQLTTISFARKSVKQDFSFIYEEYSTKTTISSDGSYVRNVYSSFLIQSQEGKEIGVQAIPFNKKSSKLRLKNAYIINNGIKTNVPSKNIVIKNTMNEETEIHNNSEMTIIYPGVKIGSKIVLEYELNIKNEFYGDEFIITNDLNKGYYLKYKETYISKEKPLNFKSYNLGSGLSVKRSKDRKKIQVYTNRTFSADRSNESHSHIDSKSFIGYLVSTTNESKDLFKHLFDDYTKLANEELPQNFPKISHSLTKYEKIYKILEEVISNISYISDHRSFKSKTVPKTPKQIWDEKNGNCKDFVLMTILALRKHGFKAFPAFLPRTESRTFNGFDDLFVISKVNHVIVYIENYKDGIFIDPTNDEPNILHIPRDISDRPALVFKERIEIIKTPKSIARKFKAIVTFNKDLSEAVVELTLEKHFREYFRRDFKENKPEHIEMMLTALSSLPADSTSFKIIKFAPNTGYFKYKLKPPQMIAIDLRNKKYAKIDFVKANSFEDFRQDSQNRYYGYQLNFEDSPEIVYKIPSTLNIPLPLFDKNINSKWLDLKLTATKDKEYININWKIDSKNVFVLSNEIKQFHKFINNLKFLDKTILIQLDHN